MRRCPPRTRTHTQAGSGRGDSIMPDKKVIAVMGATGAQGGGLVRAILADRSGEFAVRAITRKPDSDKARALAKSGVQVVPANADDPPSLEAAFGGAHG